MLPRFPIGEKSFPALLHSGADGLNVCAPDGMLCTPEAPKSIPYHILWATVLDSHSDRRRAPTDAERNCISNIRPEGLTHAEAAVTLTHLLRAMRARQISGVRLKDDRLLLDG
jgi:hypothetical protein